MKASELKLDALRLAQLCSTGELQAESDSDVFMLLKLADNAGDPKVICQLGMCFHFGWGTAKDLKAAVECYVKAVELGSFEALWRFRDLQNDQSVETDLQNAFRGFCDKADQGDARAQFNAGFCYFHGIGTPEDKARARDLFQMAANQRCADAMQMLEGCRHYRVGDGYRGMQGIELLKYAAELGSAEAQFELGLAYNNGQTLYDRKVKQDHKQAVGQLQKAADQNHIRATHNLAQCYYNGKFVQKDVKKAFQLCKKAALMGNGYAQLLTSGFYSHKSGLSEDEYPVDIDYYEAAYWNRKAVDQDQYGVKERMLDILKSIGLMQDQINELKKQTCSFNSAKIWYNIAKQYETGNGVKKKEKKAFQMYKLSARLGNTEGQVALAICYQQGIGTDQDIPQSMRWNIRATIQGNIEAAQALQKWLQQSRKQSSFKSQQSMLIYAFIIFKQIYSEWNPHLNILQHIIDSEDKSQQITLLINFFSKGQDPPDNAKTFQTCKLAIEYDMKAVYWMVRHYQHSKNIVDDFAGLPRLLEEAAELGQTEAIYCIARCHMFGLGILKNIMRAVSCFRFAAQQNHAAAQCELGCCYENGTQVQKNICDAIELYKKAADQNYIPALKTLAAIHESDDHQMKDLNRAFQYHKKAAEQGDADEQLYIAKCYRNGEAVKKSDEDALYWYEKAASNGKAEGYTYIAECYEKGIGTQVDFLKACTAYQADDPTAEMQQLLLDIIERNKNADGTDSNPGQAFRVCLKLAELYSSDANWGILAEYYENGIGTPVNFQNTSNCYLKISQTHQKQKGLLRLVRRCENGISITINMELAFKTYQYLAKSFSNAKNLLKVAEMLENGIGTETDIQQAIKYYEQAGAFSKLGDLYYEGEKVDKNLLKAGEYYLQAKQLTGKQLQILHDIMPIFSKLQQNELKYFHVAKNTADAIRHESNQIVIPVE